jgi:integrase
MGLGSCAVVSLDEARIRAETARAIVKAHKGNPVEESKRERELRSKTYGACLTQFLAENENTWGAKHASAWKLNLGEKGPCAAWWSRPISQVTRSDVKDVLLPMWEHKRPTAQRIRGCISTLFGWAIAHGYAVTDPADWDTLKPMMPLREHVVQHRAAIPYADIPRFMRELRSVQGTTARALELLALTAVRSSNVLEARWDEIKDAHRLWVIPAAKMKIKGSERENHVVPLSDQAWALLQSLPRVGEWIFPGQRYGQHLSDDEMRILMQDKMGWSATVHGLRASFRSWGQDATDINGDVLEAILAHEDKDMVARAYKRGGLLDKKRDALQRWADYCSTEPKTAKVLPLAARA